MRNRIVFPLVMTLFFTLLVVWAIPTSRAEGAVAADAGNAVCPVSGDKVSGKHFVEHGGKRFGLCCAHCEKKFKKDPEKFIAALKAGEQDHEGHMH